MAKKRKLNSKTLSAGFTLIEVMIATGIFAVFVAAFMVAQGYNISDSTQFTEELKLKSLAEQKINELVVNPPEFAESLTVGAETKSFEDDSEYEYTVEWKLFTLPDLTRSTDDGAQANDPVKMLEAKLFEKIKENMEKMIWQAEVTIKSKLSGQKYTVSTWLYNGDAELNTSSL